MIKKNNIKKKTYYYKLAIKNNFYKSNELLLKLNPKDQYLLIKKLNNNTIITKQIKDLINNYDISILFNKNYDYNIIYKTIY